MSRNSDTDTIGKVDLKDIADTASGAVVLNLQKQVNALLSFNGQTGGGVKDQKPSWDSDVVGAPNDALFARLNAMVDLFKISGGHNHDGSDGQGGAIGVAAFVQLVGAGAPQDIDTEIAFSYSKLFTVAIVQGDGAPKVLSGAGQIDSMPELSLLLLIGCNDTDTVALTPEAGELVLNGVRTLGDGTALLLGKFGGVIYEISYNGIGGL